MKRGLLSYFSKFECGLYLSSLTVILVTGLGFGECDPLSLAASLVGVTALLFIAKGNPIGQVLVIAFGIL